MEIRLEPLRLEKALLEYVRLEDEFVRLTEYIPLHPDLEAPNYQFSSPRAAVFGLDCGTWLETLMKELLQDRRLDGQPEIEKLRRQGTFSDCRKPFTEKLGWAKGGWRLKDLGGDDICPFISWGREENPEWFRVYSKLKHDRFELASTFTMGHALLMFVALTITIQHWGKPESWIRRWSRVLDGVIY